MDVIEALVAHRLPTQLTSFVGRGLELTEVHNLLHSNRLVTLTGVGGIGKTRIALQLTAELADSFRDGAWWVDLAPLVDPDLVAVQVAHTLGLADQPGRPALDMTSRHIDDRQMLVVLDNCEHLLDACATVVTALLESCPRLRILATSREPIRVAGEATWCTPSLSVADEAVELFTQRARLVRPDLAITAPDGAAVVQICRCLDGVPLAIELAAARVRALSVSEIADGLHDRFRLLTGGARDAVPRQRTLRASVDWSHALLSEPECALFRRLAVFMGGFDLSAAHAVTGRADTPRHHVLDQLSLLVDKSLVVAEQAGGGTRYRLLETVRQYGLEKLGDAGEVDSTRSRHRDHYTALFGAPVNAGLQSRIDRAEIEIDNLRAAFAWSREHGDTELAASLASSLQMLWLRGRIVEGLSWFDTVVNDSAAATRAAYARSLADKIILDHLAGVFDRIDQAEQALVIARDLGDADLLARALTACGVACLFQAERALPYFAEAIELVRGLGDNWQLSWLLAWQADATFMAGAPIPTRAAAEEGRDLADMIGDGVLSRTCRWFLGLAQWLSADLADAAEQFSSVVATAQLGIDAMWTVYGLLRLSKTLSSQGDISGARAAAEAAIEAAADMTELQQALSLGALADASLAAGDVAGAVAASESAWRAGPQRDLLAVNAYPMAQAALASGDTDAARRWVDDAAAAATGAHRMMLLATRVRVRIAQGDVEGADRDAQDALAIAAEFQAYLTIPDVIECLAGLTADAGAHREAARLFGAAQAIRDHTVQVRFRVYDAAYHAAVTAVCDAVVDFATVWDEGVALSVDEAIAYAQRGRGPRRRPARGWASLTPTERDAVRLVSEGLSNKDIAARLFISHRTVQTHLTHVYTKLGLSSRVQLVQEAARQHL